MTVAGVMSGTSADGIDVTLLQISEVSPTASRTKRTGRESAPQGVCKVKLLGHAEYSYPAKVRSAVLAAMNSTQASVADLSRLNFLLGELYADAILSTQHQFKAKVTLVGCHGQTIYHQGEAQRFMGREVAATWQTGEAAIVAARLHAPVVSDFRVADISAGGKGAPLVPFLDYLFFRDAHVGRIVQNIGGIANLTSIPAGANPTDVIAFDTGPGNMVIDALTQELYGKAFDRNGSIAGRGKPLNNLLVELMKLRYFHKRPPKTAGREEFGREFVAYFLRVSKGHRKEDIVATATALTAKTISNAIRKFIFINPRTVSKAQFREMILSGGGSKNSTLVRMLSAELYPLGLSLRLSDEFGLPSVAKEAAAFAVMAYETWRHRPSNVPSATGAKRPAILGKISYP
jgi:anhydro-N-acetylmuramic acid kinase